MKSINSPLLVALFGLILGIALYPLIPEAFLWNVLITLTGITLLIIVHFLCNTYPKFKWIFALLSMIIFTQIGGLLHSRIQPKNISNHYTHALNEQPQTFLIEIIEKLKPTPYQDKYFSEVHSINNHSTKGKILINIDSDSIHSSTLQVGHQYYIRTQAIALPEIRNPYQFDYGKYLKHKGVYSQLSISNNHILDIDISKKGIKYYAGRFRESIQKKLSQEGFTKNQLAIINALILGQRQGIDSELSAQYASAGMMHILAVSGLHVGILLLLLQWITKPISAFKLRYLRSILIILLIWGFAIFTGLSPSVLRAATMFSFLEASSLFGNKKESYNALIASALILLLFDPLLIYQVGFQLSYLAVFAILWIQPSLEKLLRPKNYIVNKLWQAATVTTAAQLGVMPLSLYYFHQFPGLFLVSNVVIIPLLGTLLGLGILTTILSYIDILPDVAVKFYGSCIDILNGFIGWVADQESFVIKNIWISLNVMIALYFVIISTSFLFKKYTFRRLWIASICVAFLAFTLFWQKSNANEQQLIVFHKSRKTLLGELDYNTLKIYTRDSIFESWTDSRITTIEKNTSINKLVSQPFKDIISYNDKRLLIIDSLGIYNIPSYHPQYILLTQSPNINLNRLISLFPESTIIADGTNYKSDIIRWKATCSKQKIPFHSTYEKGAFIIE